MSVLSRTLVEAIRQHNQRPAVGDVDGIVTYSELLGMAETVAQAMRALRRPSLSSSDEPRFPRVALQGDNSVRYVATYMGILIAGGIPFLIDRHLGAAELLDLSDRCGVDYAALDGDAVPSGYLPVATLLTQYTLSRPTRQRDSSPPMASDTEVCRFTSGTTGTSLCVEFSGQCVLEAAMAWIATTQQHASDISLCFAGLSNGLAFNTSLHTSLLTGGLLRLPRGLPTSGVVAKYGTAARPTRLIAFPALYESILRRPASVMRPALASVKLAISSAAPLTAMVREQLEQTLHLKLANYYGVAETGPVTFDVEPSQHRGLGPVIRGVELRAGSADMPASVQVRTRSMATKYLNAPDAFASRMTIDGFYNTGDVGYTEGGNLFLTGRVSPQVNIGGRKVDPMEVKKALIGAGAVDAVVLPVVKLNGDASLAAVVETHPDVTESRLRAALSDTLSAFKIPEFFTLVDALPRNTVGKPVTASARSILMAAHYDARLREPTE